MVDKFDRRILFSYLQNKYSLTKLPKHFYMKMSNIFSGKLEGLTKKIPAEHLYDMWQRKSNYLDKVHMKNISMGKKMDSYVMLNYDLAILISKYDDYLSWLDKQKALTTKNENLKDNVTVTDVLYKYNIHNNNTNNENDLSDIIDDLI